MKVWIEDSWVKYIRTLGGALSIFRRGMDYKGLKELLEGKLKFTPIVWALLSNLVALK